MTTTPINLAELNKARLANQSNRALETAARSYKAECVNRAMRIERATMLGSITAWADMGIDAGEIPPSVRAQPYVFINVKSFLMMWIATAEARFKLLEQSRRVELKQEPASTRFVAAETSADIKRVGRFTLKPRQRKAVDLAIERLRSGTTNAVVVPLEGGEGKSVIAWALVNHWMDNNYFGHIAAKIPINNVYFATPANVVINMTRRATQCAVRGINNTVHVVPHSSWNSKAYKPFFKRVETEEFGNKGYKFQYILPAPAIVIIDENDVYKKPTSLKSRYMRAIVEKGLEQGSVFVFMSATPWVTINDTWLFCLATGRKWAGQRITMESFPAMAKTIASRVGMAPNDNSEKAIKAFREEFNDCFIVPPRDPSKVKVFNKTLLVDFKSPEQRRYYEDTIRRYKEEMRREGKGDLEVNPLALLGKLAFTEERLKCPNFADLMVEAHARGKAPVCGVQSQDAVKEITRILVKEKGIPREKISVLWGGCEIITKDKIQKLIGPAFFKNIGFNVAKFLTEPETMSKSERTAVRKYLKWAKEAARFDETRDEQAMRHEELLTLRLDQQSLEQRQDEMDAFQEGRTEYCVFSLGAGGRGVDLDQQFEHVRPRELFITICYYAEQFMQALFRCKRAGTLESVTQNVVFFRNTIVADHVAPLLDSKIKAIRAGSGMNIADAVIELLMKDEPTEHVDQAQLRDGTDTEEVPEGFDAEKELDKIETNADDEDDDEEAKQPALSL